MASAAYKLNFSYKCSTLIANIAYTVEAFNSAILLIHTSDVVKGNVIPVNIFAPPFGRHSKIKKSKTWVLPDAVSGMQKAKLIALS